MKSHRTYLQYLKTKALLVTLDELTEKEKRALKNHLDKKIKNKAPYKIPVEIKKELELSIEEALKKQPIKPEFLVGANHERIHKEYRIKKIPKIRKILKK